MILLHAKMKMPQVLKNLEVHISFLMTLNRYVNFQPLS